MGCFMVFLSVIALLCVGFTESTGLYVTTMIKNMYGILPKYAETFVIPDGQCSGYIDRKLICFNQAAGAVQVQVEDNIAFPSVLIDNNLLIATIQRMEGPGGSCAGEAEVQLSYNCLQDQPPFRQRRSLRLLPPAPIH